METSPATNPPNVPILIGPDRRDILVIPVVTRAAEIWRTNRIIDRIRPFCPLAFLVSAYQSGRWLVGAVGIELLNQILSPADCTGLIPADPLFSRLFVWVLRPSCDQNQGLNGMKMKKRCIVLRDNVTTTGPCFCFSSSGRTFWLVCADPYIFITDCVVMLSD